MIYTSCRESVCVDLHQIGETLTEEAKRIAVHIRLGTWSTSG